MRQGWIALALAGLLGGLAACAGGEAPEFDSSATATQADAIGEVLSSIDREDLELAKLTSLVANKGSPEANIQYFKSLIEKEPENLSHVRGLAMSLAQARRHDDAARIWATAVERGGGRDADRFGYLRALSHARRWDEAAEQLSALSDKMVWTVPNRLYAAVVLDNTGQWTEADRAYAQALGQSRKPAQILNNWGVSKMGRGDYDAAAQLFNQALDMDESLTVAKVNLAFASALKGDFTLPSGAMSEIERAHLYHDVGLIALRRGDRETARRLFRAALDHHPRHYRKAADMLAQLDGTQSRTPLQ